MSLSTTVTLLTNSVPHHLVSLQIAASPCFSYTKYHFIIKPFVLTTEVSFGFLGFLYL